MPSIRPVVALALAAMLPGSRPAAAYETADLLGEWRLHSLASGPGAPWWERAHALIGADGQFVATTLTNLGERDTIGGTFGLSGAGVLSLQGSSVFRGAVDVGRTLLVATDTWTSGAAGTTELKLGVKSVGAFRPADLAGIWELRSIASGPGEPWWYRGRMTVAPDGSFTGDFTEIGGGTSTESGSLSLSPEGLVSISVSGSLVGAMDAGRTVMVMTNTWSGFMAGTTELSACVKMAPSYAQADLVGTWEFHTLAAGPGAPWWRRAQITIAADGSFTGWQSESSGGSGPTSGTITLAPNGQLTRSGSTTALGALDAGKSMMVWNDTWTTGAPGTAEFLVAMRTGGSLLEVADGPDLAFALEPVFPNPAAGGVPAVAFRLATARPARLDLLDVRGRLVASRDVGALGAGHHRVAIGEGVRLSPGLYWVRLTQGADARVRRVTVLSAK